MVEHMVDTWWIVEVDVVCHLEVKFAPVVGTTGCPPGVPPGGMARSGPFTLYERCAFLSKSGVVLFSARLCEWDKLDHVKVDRVKLVAGEEEVPTTLFKVQLPAAALAKLVVAPRGKTAKEQFGMSPDDEYGIPPGVDFRTSLRIGERRTHRLGESCVVPLI